MGQTAITVAFFTDDITIEPHTASQREHVGIPITIADFAGERAVALYELGNGDYYCRRTDGAFIEGPEV